MQCRDEQTRETIAVVRSRWSGAAQVGVILGTGLGSFAREIEAPVAIDVRDLDFVRPVRGVTDGGGRGVDPEACGQLRACGDQGRHHCGDHSGIQNFHLIFARSSSAQFSTT